MKLMKKPWAALVVVVLIAVAVISLLGSERDRHVDLIVFSYNRPLQLYAFLESSQQYLTGLGATIVIYRSGNKAFHDAYEKVRSAFPWAQFWEQGSNPTQDFKPLTMKALAQTSSAYIMFAVDDIVVKDYVDLALCVKLLEKTGAYGFYLRLGTRITDCYACSAAENVPAYERVDDAVISWTLGRATYDWGYPNTVDMTVYRKADVVRDFNSFAFTNPNTLEGYWSMLSGRESSKKGICFEESKIVNLPLNRVQDTYHNRTMNSFLPEDLLDVFNKGLKMDIQPLFQVKNAGPHMEYVPTFVTR